MFSFYKKSDVDKYNKVKKEPRHLKPGVAVVPLIKPKSFQAIETIVEEKNADNYVIYYDDEKWSEIKLSAIVPVSAL